MIHSIVRRFRPPTGWPLALLIFSAALCPAMAAAEATLPLPANLIGWAGLLGAALGLRIAALPNRVWRWFYLPVALTLSMLLLLASSAALPPIWLFWHDAQALVALVATGLSGASPAVPELLTPRFLQLALPRAWQALLAAPTAGESGAALIVAGMTLITTVSGALALGYGCAAGRHMLGWGLPLTLALGIVTIFGGGDGAGLVIGMSLLLGLAGFAGYKVRTQRWDATGVAYSDELRWGVLGWGVCLVGSALMLGLLIPTSIPLLPVGIAAGDGDLPSGLAAIEGRVDRGEKPQPVDPGLSQLPVVTLGVALNAAPPEQLALRVRLTQPLPPGPYPHYWRARVLTIYNGRTWWANARIDPLIDAGTTTTVPEGMIRQEFELLDADQQVLVALPDALNVDIPVRWEYLPDGTLAALTGEPPNGRYTVLSRPQAFAPLAEVESGTAPPPDYRSSLALPPDLPLRVADLARTITAGATDAHAQALALEAYLRGLPYAYEVQPIPANGDAVDQFLFEMRRGYCTYYASAMVVMARSLGIPARLAVGYATGSYDEALDAYLVYAADAHAWPELLIDGRWLPFEPTPVLPLPARTTGNPQPVPVPIPQPEAAPAQDRQLTSLLLLLLLIGFTALLGLAGWFFRRVGRPSALEQAQRQLERFGARAGVAWPPGVTVHEYGQLLTMQGLAGNAPISEVVRLIEQARYSHRPLNSSQDQQLRAGIRALRAATIRSSRH